MSMIDLTEILRRELHETAPPALCVAFSGGPDSTALLHALAQLRDARATRLRALHVDHGLHSASPDWARHCSGFCASLDIPLTTVRVHIEDNRGEGIEAAARRARRGAFAEHLREGEWLVLAHHRDDQVETVLLKLLRGAGPEGLGGMRPLRSFGQGFLWRPLLETSRETIRNYLSRQNIAAVDDPANQDPRFARNVLRQEVLPTLARYWPNAGTSILHTARLCRAAADYIAHEVEAKLELLCRDDQTLDADGWLALPDALRALALDAWLHLRGLTAPPDATRAELERQTAHAADDRVPLVAWPGAEVRVWDGRLHATPPLAQVPWDWRAAWHGAPLPLPPDCGTLTCESIDKASPPETVRFDPGVVVGFRRGGERIKPAGEPHTRELRDLFQQARIPPWLRVRCPVIYAEGELIAVADLWISERGKAFFDARGAKPRWLRPSWAAVTIRRFDSCPR